MIGPTRQSGIAGSAHRNCPKCGREMKDGQTGNRLAFNRQRHKLSLNPKDGEDVMIAKKSFASSDFHEWICKPCGMVVFDYQSVITRW
ncbi:PF20097 family protein [uncultured Dysosmobacter sp.]|uniref:PF20097 family protein n=1 Tax=uncultured Dysosmobacter sp. TaxID=2591384 RepID=UPI0026214F7F|nr:PF20097 family protein [uncultured Dysosmobacter sp.]